MTSDFQFIINLKKALHGQKCLSVETINDDNVENTIKINFVIVTNKLSQ